MTTGMSFVYQRVSPACIIIAITATNQVYCVTYMLLLLLLLSIMNDDNCQSGSVSREMPDKSNPSMANTTTNTTDVGRWSIEVQQWGFFATLSFGLSFTDATEFKLLQPDFVELRQVERSSATVSHVSTSSLQCTIVFFDSSLKCLYWPHDNENRLTVHHTYIKTSDTQSGLKQIYMTQNQ